MIVAESPYKYDDQENGVFATEHLNKIKRFFETTGLKVYCTYAVKCFRSKEVKVTPTHIKTCKTAYLQHELAIVKPKHIVTLGASSLKALGKTGNVLDIHGQPIQDPKLPFIIYPTIHQAQAAYSEDKKQELYADLRLFKKWITNGIEEAAKFEPPIRMASTLKALLAVEKKIRKHGGVVAADIETTDLNPYEPNGKVRCLQLCWDEVYGGIFIPLDLEEDCYYSDKKDTEQFWTKEPIEEAIRIVRRILKHSKLVWHNGKFDRLWLYNWGQRRFGKPIECPNLFMDTMHVAYLINENRRLKLKKLLTEEFGFLSYDIDDKLTKDLSILIPYATRDTVATLMLCRKYCAVLQTEDMARVKRFYFKVLRKVDALYTKIELEGWPVSGPRATELVIDLTKKVEKSLAKMNAILGKEDLGPYEAKTFNSPDKMSHILFSELALRPNPDQNISRTDTGELSTGNDALIHLKYHPLVAELLEYRSLAKALNTYAVAMENAAKTRGKITTSYKIAKVVTGRTASGKEEGQGSRGKGKGAVGMNLQNLPPTFGIKNCIMQEPETQEDIDDPWWILEVDFSQIELRIAGELSNDRMLIWAYANGVDLHTYRAKRMLRVTDAEWEALDPKEKKQARLKAKPVNFGFLYGMGWMKFRQFALTDYGVVFTADESREIREDFFEVHEGLPKWYARQEAQVKRLGYVETLSGRRRHLSNIKLDPDSSKEAKQKYQEAIRMAINSPVQSFGSDLKLMAMIELDEVFDGAAYAKLFGEVHDSILMKVRRSKVLEVAEKALQILRHPRLLDELGIVLRIPIDAEAEAGPSLGEKKEVSEWEELRAA